MIWGGVRQFCFGLFTVMLLGMLTACEPTMLAPTESIPAEAGAETETGDTTGAIPLASDTFTSEQSGYTVTFPDGWQVFSLLEGSVDQLVVAVEAQAASLETAGALGPAIAQLLAAGGMEGVELIAVGPEAVNGQSELVLTITIVERHGLTLAQYLGSVEAGLSADVDIVQSDLRYRNGAATLSTWLQFNYQSADGATLTTYGQHAQLASADDKFLLFSFAGPNEQFNSNQSAIDTILDSLVSP